MIEMIEMKTKPLDFKYDSILDVLTVEGMKYSGDFFRAMATYGPSIKPFRIVERTGDGVVVLESVDLFTPSSKA